MELDELKKTWTILDNRLKENNSLNERIILEITKSKVEKSIQKLLRGEITGTIIIFLLIPFIIYSFRADFIYIRMLFWVILISAILSAIWQVYKVSVLIKIDLSKNVKNNIYYVNKHKILIKWEFLAVIYIIVPLFFILGFLYYATLKAGLPLWTFFASIFIISVIGIWYSKKEYKKTFKKIQDSLDEIKDLKEE